MTLSVIRAELAARGFSKPRISQLTRPLRATGAVFMRRHGIVIPALNPSSRRRSIELVENMRQAGLTLNEIRVELAKQGFSKPRISQLTKSLKDEIAGAAVGAIAHVRSSGEVWRRR